MEIYLWYRIGTLDLSDNLSLSYDVFVLHNEYHSPQMVNADHQNVVS